MNTSEINKKRFDLDIQNIFLDYFNKKENTTPEEISQRLVSCFQNGLTWHDFAEIRIPTKKEQINPEEFKQIKDSDIFILKELIQPIFNGYFIQNLTDKNYHTTSRNIYRSLGNKAFSHDFFNNDNLKIFWELFDLSNMDRYRNEFLIHTSSTKQLQQLTNLFNISPLTVVTKDQNIETFLLTNVCQREMFSPKYWCSKTNDYTKLQNEFIKIKGHLDRTDLQTEKTSLLDLRTRIAFTFSYLKDESKYNKLLNSIGIKEVNLNCVDYLFSKKNAVSYKDKLLEFSKIKTLNKFNKNKKDNPTDLSRLITTRPDRPNLISNKKSFLKNWLAIPKENIDLTEILSEVVKSQHKKHDFASVDIKCYLPIRHKYLDEPESYWKQPERRRYEQIEFLNLEFGSSYDSFFNLITYSNAHQEKINWKEPVLNSTLAEELYALLLKIPTLPALNSEKNTNINSVENLLRSFTDDIKVDILKNIDKNWKTIFDSKKEEEMKQLFTNPYGMKCSFLNIFNMILDEAIKTKEKIILDNKEIIIASIEKYIDNSTDAKEIIQKVSYIDLNKSLNEKAPERKRLKI